MGSEQPDTQEHVFRFHFLLSDGADRAGVTAVLRERLAKLDDVAELTVSPGTTRAIDPLSVAAAIGVSVLIVKQTAEGVEALTRLIQAVKKLVAEIEGVSEARLEVGDQVRRVDDLRTGDLDAAAGEAVE
jgi:hypothetical protein